MNRGEQAEAVALRIARQLRAAGVSVELDGSGAAFGKQFKRADRSGAAWAAVIGEEEVKAGQLSLKPLLTEEDERQVSLDDPAEIGALLWSAK